MSQLIVEIDETIKLLEARLPGSLENPANQRLERRLERSMAEYFTNLHNAVPSNKIEEIYYRNVKQE